MRKLFLAAAVSTIFGFAAGNTLASTYTFDDDWIDWNKATPGSTYESQIPTVDENEYPHVTSMDVTVSNDGSKLEKVEIFLYDDDVRGGGWRQLYDSLFINTSYDGSNWDDWDHFVMDDAYIDEDGVEHTYDHTENTEGTKADDGLWDVVTNWDVDSPDYTMTLLANGDRNNKVRHNTPNGIDVGSLTNQRDFDPSFTGDHYASIITYDFTVFGGGLSITDGFFIAYSSWCGNDVMGGGAAVPEPATMLLFGTGLIGLAGFARRRNKK